MSTISAPAPSYSRCSITETGSFGTTFFLSVWQQSPEEHPASEMHLQKTEKTEESTGPITVSVAEI